MARYASLLIVLLFVACSDEENKNMHDWSCAYDKRRISELNECFRDAGCEHEAYHYRIRDDLKDRVAKDCVSN